MFFCHSQVLQDLGLPTGSESKSESSVEVEGTQESVKAATTSSTTSEDVRASVPPSGVMYLEALPHRKAVSTFTQSEGKKVIYDCKVFIVMCN